jgi:hypothetical protein
MVSVLVSSDVNRAVRSPVVTVKIYLKSVALVQSGHHHHPIQNSTCSRHDIAKKNIAHSGGKQSSFTH